MTYKQRLLLSACFLAAAVVVNSCKKDNQSSIHTLFTGNTWQLASAIKYSFVGDTLKKTDTLNSLCNDAQYFTFKSDNTCTYTNFDCKDQPVSSGKWSLSTDQLFLMSDMTCQLQDTTKVVSPAAPTTKPFAIAKIINLGQYSLILRTGDLDVYYPPDKKRNYITYGFVRVKAP